MKGLSSKARVEAFTLIEVLVVIVIVFVLAALLLPVLAPVKPRRQAPCLNNQRQIALNFAIWETDNGGKFPWQISSTNGGSMEFISTGKVSPHFKSLSKYISRQPNLLICPTDKARTVATNFAELTERNVSYFVNVDISTNNPSLSILTGDRHLQSGGNPVKPGLFIFTNGMSMSWTRELHDNPNHGSVGAIAFADGHMQAIMSSGKDLTDTFQRQGLAIDRLVVP